MTTELRVKLPERAYRRIERLAELAGRNVEDAVALTLDITLPPLRSELDLRPIPSLSDEDILNIADSIMDETFNARMSALIQKQKRSLTLTGAEEAELEMLWDLYDVGQIRKAEAWVEAVKRGLRAPPKS